jgi:PAS domain S-box-containing protein
MNEPNGSRQLGRATDRRHPEDAIGDREMLMEMAEQLAGFGYWRIDLPRKAVFWSAGIYDILGLPKSYEPVFDQAISLYHPGDRAAVGAAIERSIAHDRPLNFEARIRHAGGAYRYVTCRGRVERNALGSASALFGVFQDVTERHEITRRDRETAAALREKNRVMQMAERISHVGHWRLDVGGDVMWWSDEVYRIWGVSKAFVPTLANRVAARHPDDRARTAEAIRTAVAAKAEYTDRSRIIRPDGAIREIVVHGKPEFALDGSLRAYIGVCRDITEATNAARERETLIERMTLATRAATIGIWEWNLVTGEAIWDASMFALYALPSNACRRQASWGRGWNRMPRPLNGARAVRRAKAVSRAKPTSRPKPRRSHWRSPRSSTASAGRFVSSSRWPSASWNPTCSGSRTACSRGMRRRCRTPLTGWPAPAAAFIPASCGAGVRRSRSPHARMLGSGRGTSVARCAARSPLSARVPIRGRVEAA